MNSFKVAPLHFIPDQGQNFMINTDAPLLLFFLLLKFLSMLHFFIRMVLQPDVLHVFSIAIWPSGSHGGHFPSGN